MKISPSISEFKVENFIITIKKEKRNPGTKNREETERTVASTFFNEDVVQKESKILNL